jgi:hypothetical protein
MFLFWCSLLRHYACSVHWHNVFLPPVYSLSLMAIGTTLFSFDCLKLIGLKCKNHQSNTHCLYLTRKACPLSFPIILRTPLKRHSQSSCQFQSRSETREYSRGKYHCTIDLLFDWFGISCMMTTDNFCFYLQNRPIQTS